MAYATSNTAPAIDKPPVLGVITSVTNDLLSARQDMEQLRSRMENLVGELFGAPPKEIKTESLHKDVSSAVERLQELTNRLSTDLGILHGLVGKLESLV